MSKICTDIPQSKILAEILSIESADMHYVRKTHNFMGNPVDGKWSYPEYGNPNSKHAGYVVQNFESYEKIPCWSLAALLGVLPSASLDSSDDNYYRIHCNGKFSEWHDNPVDACVEMIELLHEKNLI